MMENFDLLRENSQNGGRKYSHYDSCKSSEDFSLDDLLTRDLEKLEKFAEDPLLTEISASVCEDYSPPIFRGKIDLNAKPKKSILKRSSTQIIENNPSASSFESGISASYSRIPDVARRDSYANPPQKISTKNDEIVPLNQMIGNQKSSQFHDAGESEFRQASFSGKYSTLNSNIGADSARNQSRFGDLSPLYDAEMPREDFVPETHLVKSFEQRNNSYPTLDTEDGGLANSKSSFSISNKRNDSLTVNTNYKSQAFEQLVSPVESREVVYGNFDKFESKEYPDSPKFCGNRDVFFDDHSQFSKKRKLYRDQSLKTGHRSQEYSRLHERSSSPVDSERIRSESENFRDDYYDERHSPLKHKEVYKKTGRVSRSHDYRSYRNSRSPEFYDKWEYEKRYKSPNERELYSRRRSPSPTRSPIIREKSYSPYKYKKCVSPYYRSRSRSITPLRQYISPVHRARRRYSRSITPSPPRSISSRKYSGRGDRDSNSRSTSSTHCFRDRSYKKSEDAYDSEDLDMKIDDFLKKNSTVLDYGASRRYKQSAKAVPYADTSYGRSYSNWSYNYTNNNMTPVVQQCGTSSLQQAQVTKSFILDTSSQSTPSHSSMLPIQKSKNQSDTVVNGIEVDEEKRKKLIRNKKKWLDKQIFLSNELLKLKEKALAKEREDKTRSLHPVDIENGKLQKEISRQLGNVESIISRINKLLGEEKTGYSVAPSCSANENKPEINPSSQSQISISYFDTQSHWCPLCNIYFGGLATFLKHLHSDKHMNEYKKSIGDTKPWRKFDNAIQEKDMGGKKLSVPCGGSEKLVAVKCYYCEMCNEWLGDCVMVSEHITGVKHNSNYKKFLNQQPGYEPRLNKQKDKCFRLFMKDKEAKENEKNKKEKDKQRKKLEENKKQWDEFVQAQQKKYGLAQELEEFGPNAQGTSVQTSSGAVKKDIKLNLKDQQKKEVVSLSPPPSMGKEEQRQWENLRAKALKKQLEPSPGIDNKEDLPIVINVDEDPESELKPNSPTETKHVNENEIKNDNLISFEINNVDKEAGVSQWKKKALIGKMPSLRKVKIEKKVQEALRVNVLPVGVPVIKKGSPVNLDELDCTDNIGNPAAEGFQGSDDTASTSIDVASNGVVSTVDDMETFEDTSIASSLVADMVKQISAAEGMKNESIFSEDSCLKPIGKNGDKAACDMDIDPSAAYDPSNPESPRSETECQDNEEGDLELLGISKQDSCSVTTTEHPH